MGCMVRKWLWWVGLMLLMGACTTPMGRQVQDVDSSEGRLQLIYDERTESGEYERGVIECDLEGDELSNCSRLDVEYQ